MPDEQVRERQEILASEAAFFDREWAAAGSEAGLAINAKLFAQYAVPRHVWHYREHVAMLLGPVRGKRLFDMGCGLGEESVYFAKMGAEVTAMDISPEGIRQVHARAAHNHVTIDGRVGDVTATGLPGASFDLIHGIGILHHVGLAAGMREAHRLLAPGGRAVFSEHMSSSRFVDRLRHWYNGGDEAYTSDERPLTWDESKALRQNYDVELYPWSLLFRLRRPVPFFGRPLVQRTDHLALKLCPPLRHFCGAVIIVLKK